MDGLDLSKIPAAVPPPGIIPNFIDPPSLEEFPKIVTYITLPLMVFFLGLRIYARVRLASVGVDDYLCILSAASIVVYIALCFKVIEQGSGPHMWDIPVSKITVSYAKNTTTLALIYFVAAMFIKAGILAMYLRIFRPSHNAKILLWTGIVLSTMFYIASIAVYLGTCLPRKEDDSTGGWLSPQFADRVYAIEGDLSAATGIVGTVIDLYILIAPLTFLWSLRLPLRRKAGVSAVFIAGSAACIFSVCGVVYRMRIAKPTAEAQDLSWNTMPIYAMSIAEINVGIACSCMPVIFVLFKGFTSWSASWLSKLRYGSSGHREHSKPSDASDSQMAEYKNVDEEALPQVPKSALTGLKSVMRNFNRTRPAATQTAPATRDILSVRSADYSYHEQLKQGAKSVNSR